MIKVGIVGTNFISDMFMYGAKDIAEIKVTAVTSGHKENAIKFAQKYHIETIYDSLDEMLEKREVDCVYLAVPNHLHYEMSKQCILSHMPVITEKPFVPTIRQAKELFSLAKQENVLIHDAIVPLYSKQLDVVKAYLPKIGRMKQVIISFSKYSSRYDAYREGKNPTTFRKEMCNGCWMDLGIYCIAAMIGLFGKPNSIMASSVLLDTGVDGSSTGIFKYDGFDVIIVSSKVSDTEIISEIEGEDGTIYIPYPSRMHMAYYKKRGSDEKIKITSDERDSFIDQLEEFVKNMKEGNIESKKVPHQLSLDVIDTMEKARLMSGVIYDCDKE